MIRRLSSAHKVEHLVPSPSPCEHRAVSKDGRIVCAKIVAGDNTVSPEICHRCPVRAVNCQHLGFSLRQTSPSPLIVRFNGRTEIWDDEAPEVLFDQAACAARVMPIASHRSCAGCTMHRPVDAPAGLPAPRQRRAAVAGKVVPFPGRRAGTTG